MSASVSVRDEVHFRSQDGFGAPEGSARARERRLRRVARLALETLKLCGEAYGTRRRGGRAWSEVRWRWDGQCQQASVGRGRQHGFD